MLLLLVSCITAVSLFAQQQIPTLERGLNPEKLYQFNGLDNVNIFNGNLTIILPIGLAYPLDGGLTYQLRLSYNSNTWDFARSGSGTMAYPARRSNAGAGWIVGFGAFLPAVNANNNAFADVYQSADGGDHRFDSPQSSTFVKYTTDGSNLRLRTLTSPPSVAWIDFPDGSTQYYEKQSDDSWFLKEIDAPRGTAKVTFTKLASRPAQCPSTTDAWQKIHDTSNRDHYLCFETWTMDDVSKPLIDTIVFDGPQNQVATYQFTYETIHNVPDPPGAEPPDPIPGGWRYLHDVTLLKSIVMPDSSSYAFEHNSGAQLLAMVLPTKGRIEYTYLPIYDIPPVALCAQGYNTTTPYPSFGTELTAIASRIVRNVVPSSKPADVSVWTYSWRRNVNAAGQYYCYGPTGLNWVDDPLSYELISTVVDPNGGRVDSHFSIWPGDMATDSAAGFKGRFNGFPYGPYDAAQNRWLSQEQFQCGPGGAEPCTKLRSTYVRHDLESRPPLPQFPNAEMPIHRLASQRVFHHDNPVGCSVSGGTPCKSITTESTDWDGLGHYRVLTTSHDIGTPVSRTVTTDWNKVGGVQRVIGVSDNWTLDEYERMTTQEGSSIRVEQVCYADVSETSTKRYPKARRLLKGTTPGPNDLITLYGIDASGNVVNEKYYGGDVVPLPSGAAGASTLCDAVSGSLGTSTYELNHTWQYGVLATTQYAGAAFKSLNLTIDRSGVVSDSRDVADVVTTYNYDSLGRLTTITPTGSLATSYTYPGATVSGGYLTAPATATQVTGTGVISSEVHYQYDSLGRLWRQKSRMPGGSWSVRETLYDSYNRMKSVSQQEALVGTELSFTPSAITTYTYDSFSRPLEIVSPDTSKTRYSYLGTQERKLYITDPGMPERLRSTERYDGFGQLTTVIERPDSAGDVVTSYKYDVASRLKTVTMKAPDGVVQNRIFDYDGRGFLRWESHPESGMTSYTYDARGHMKTKEQSAAQSQFDLRYTYDSSERLYRIEGRNPFYPEFPDQWMYRPIKEFSFGTANGSVTKVEDEVDVPYWDLRKGKLIKAVRYNYGQSPVDSTIAIETEYEYLDAPGRNTHRTTNIFKDEVQMKTVEMSQTYNGLGLPVDLRYPMCEDCGAPASDPDRRYMNRSYDRGRLKTINGFIDNITYWPNGMRNVIQHSNGIADTQTVGNMPRPTSLNFAEYDRCLRPTFTQQPSSTDVPTGGGVATLSVQVAGVGPFQYEWWNITDGVVAGSTATITPTVTHTTEYYVTVSNACGFEESHTAVVSVGNCSNPSTGSIRAVRQPDGSWILRPEPTARSGATYVWRRLSDNALMGTSETLAVANVTVTTTFSLTVSDSCGYATSNVTIEIPLPITRTGLQANWSGPQIDVTWPAVSGATGYVVERRAGADWEWKASVTTNSYHDSVIESGITYAYRVYATSSGNSSEYSNSDVATTRTFAQVASGDNVTAASVTEMLAAVNSVRAAAGWPAVTWTNVLSPTSPVPAPGAAILAQHILSCRARMNEALQALGSVVNPYADADLAGLQPSPNHVNAVLGRTQ
ncbi:MAG TPA: hypothetical protein VHW00_15290 [Thermoanaerobaculia bacterium]|nr:hypothetical protein [Thermoanaerobaculia bacterium]